MKLYDTFYETAHDALMAVVADSREAQCVIVHRPECEIDQDLAGCTCTPSVVLVEPGGSA